MYYALGGNHMNAADKIILKDHKNLVGDLSAFIHHRPCKVYILPVLLISSSSSFFFLKK